MPKVSATIPVSLQSKVDLAVDWFNASTEARGEYFKVTGILDPDAAEANGGSELQLILCGGDRCEQHTFQIDGQGEKVDISFLVTDEISQAEVPQAELDPPPGPRLGWLDNVISKHNFVVLLFYRGFW